MLHAWFCSVLCSNLVLIPMHCSLRPNQTEGRVHQAAERHGLGLGCALEWRHLPVCTGHDIDRNPIEELKDWPFILPHTMVPWWINWWYPFCNFFWLLPTVHLLYVSILIHYFLVNIYYVFCLFLPISSIKICILTSTQKFRQPQGLPGPSSQGHAKTITASLPLWPPNFKMFFVIREFCIGDPNSKWHNFFIWKSCYRWWRSSPWRIVYGISLAASIEPLPKKCWRESIHDHYHSSRILRALAIVGIFWYHRKIYTLLWPTQFEVHDGSVNLTLQAAASIITESPNKLADIGVSIPGSDESRQKLLQILCP